MMQPALRRAAFALPVLLGLGSTAQASELVCPNRITIGGIEARALQGSAGTARIDPQGRLLCAFASVSFFGSSERPAGGGPCLARSFAPQVAGGSGSWRFGPPGSPPSIMPPIQEAGAGCVYGGPGYTLPTLVAWREPPTGERCTPHPRDGSRFLCAAATTAAPSPGTTEVAGHCPGQLSAGALPSQEWEDGRTPTGYYPPESYILDAESGRLVKANAALLEVQQAMGPAWRRAIFLLSRTPTAQARLPPGTYSCSYEGPRFRQGRRTLEANIAIACTGGCTIN
jgi:hypothetical protein